MRLMPRVDHPGEQPQDFCDDCGFSAYRLHRVADDRYVCAACFDTIQSTPLTSPEGRNAPE